MLEGQRTEVAVVFCDLRGFTAFSNKAEPEEIIAVLNEYYSMLGAVVTRHEGTLTSFQGDGLMIILNAPIPCPDPALRAVRMATEMQENIQPLIQRWRARGYVIGFGVGLAFGAATVGQIGTGSRLEYTAIGNVVNLAARLCASAADGEILFDVAIAREVGTTLPTIALGTRPLKGYDQQVPVFAVKLPTLSPATSAA